VDSQALADEYRGKTDEELLRLALEQMQLTPEAKTILDHELAKRRIDTNERLMALRQREAMCLDDMPSVARLAARQQFLGRWSRLLAIAPFVVVLFVLMTFFPKSTSPIPIGFIFASLIWAIGVVGYSFFLDFAIKCPACGWKFGIGDKCMNCGASRHRNAGTPPSAL
jgi:hypothetical protein